MKLPDGSAETFYLIDDICHEWEERTGLVLNLKNTKVFKGC